MPDRREPKLAAFRVVEDPAGRRRWERTDRAPYAEALGGDDFLLVPAGARAYVDGQPVAGGVCLLRPGHFVRVYGHRGQEAAYRYAGRTAGPRREPAAGRRCRFLGVPLDGEALVCAACGAALTPYLADALDACVCGSPLRSVCPESPPEDLL